MSVVRRAQLSFSVQSKVAFGTKIVVVGNPKRLGKWDIGGAKELKWNTDDVWTGSVELPNGEDVEFKLVKVSDHGDVIWEKGDNRTVRIDDKDVEVEIGMDNVMVVNGAVRSAKVPAAQTKSSQASPRRSSSGSVDERPAHVKWQGQNVNFMSENNHSKERRGVWNKSGLEGALLELVKGDERAGR